MSYFRKPKAEEILGQFPKIDFQINAQAFYVVLKTKVWNS